MESRLDFIVDKVVAGFPWAGAAIAIFAMMFLWAFTKLFDMKIMTLISGVFAEIRSLATRKVNAGSVNLITIILMSSFALFYFAQDKFRELVDVVGMARTGGGDSDAGLVVLTIGLIGVSMILSILAVNATKPKP